MKCAIMQPYFFPYIGYFQLVNAVDQFVLYDDVNFINKGWINRNNIIGKHGPQRITLQLSGASQNKLINEISLGSNREKLLKTINQTYAKAPYFDDVYPMLEALFRAKTDNLSEFLHHSIIGLCEYLNIGTKILLSSELKKDSTLKAGVKIKHICKVLNAQTYINTAGGRDLYNRESFQSENIELYFLKPDIFSYKQFDDEFLPNLSIIDILMFNSPKKTDDFLERYELDP